MVATYTREEILELHDEFIVLPRPDSMCNLERIENLERIIKNRNEISLIGDVNRIILTNLRSIKYLYQYSRQGVHLFDEQDFKRFLRDDTDELNTRCHPFEITVIKEFSTDIGFAITSKRLIPTTENVFLQYYHNEQPIFANPQPNIPFELGSTQIENENGRAVRVDFGCFNGRDSIKVFDNATKIDQAKHEEEDIRNLCARIRQVLEAP